MHLLDDLLPGILSYAINLPLEYGYRCGSGQREERFHEESRSNELIGVIRTAFNLASPCRLVCKKWNNTLVRQFDGYFVIVSNHLSPDSLPMDDRLIRPERVRFFSVQDNWLTPRRLDIIGAALKKCRGLKRLDVSISVALMPTDVRQQVIRRAGKIVDEVATSNSNLKCITWFFPDIDICHFLERQPISHLTIGTRSSLSCGCSLQNLTTIVIVVSFNSSEDFFAQLRQCRLNNLRNLVLDGGPRTSGFGPFLASVESHLEYMEICNTAMSIGLEREISGVQAVRAKGVGLTAKSVVRLVTRSAQWSRLHFIDLKSLNFETENARQRSTLSLIGIAHQIEAVFGSDREIRLRMRDVIAPHLKGEAWMPVTRIALGVAIWALANSKCVLYFDDWQVLDGAPEICRYLRGC